MILVKLAQKLVLSLPRKNLVFNPKKGRIYAKRTNKLLISVKDPFMKEINYGMQMRDREKLKHLVDVLKAFIKAAANKSIDAFFVDRGDLPMQASATSMNQTSNSNSGGSPDSGSGGDKGKQEESKEPLVSNL